MARLSRGPFNLIWGGNTLADIEEIDVEVEVSTDEYETIQGATFELDGSYRASVVVTLLATDIASLAVIMPQYFVPNGGQMSTGETVNNAAGAIDVRAAACDEGLIYNNLDIESCANPADVLRLVNARSRIEDVDIDNKVRKVMVRFIAEPTQTEAVIQFFTKGTINVVS
jgi:hypothetical protein